MEIEISEMSGSVTPARLIFLSRCPVFHKNVKKIMSNNIENTCAKKQIKNCTLIFKKYSKFNNLRET